MIRALHYLCPWTDVMKASKDDPHFENGGGEGASTGLQFSLEKNFGELEFDWDERVVRLRAMGDNPHGPPLLMAQYSMDQLSGRSPLTQSPTQNPLLTTNDFAHESLSRRQALQTDSEWVCVNHRGRDCNLSHMMGHASTAVGLIALVPLPLLLPVFVCLYLIRRLSSKTVISPSTIIDNKRDQTVGKAWLKDIRSNVKAANLLHFSELIPFRFKTVLSFAKLANQE